MATSNSTPKNPANSADKNSTPPKQLAARNEQFAIQLDGFAEKLENVTAALTAGRELVYQSAHCDADGVTGLAILASTILALEQLFEQMTREVASHG